MVLRFLYGRVVRGLQGLSIGSRDSEFLHFCLHLLGQLGGFTDRQNGSRRFSGHSGLEQSVVISIAPADTAVSGSVDENGTRAKVVQRAAEASSTVDCATIDIGAEPAYDTARSIVVDGSAKLRYETLLSAARTACVNCGSACTLMILSLFLTMRQQATVAISRKF